MLFHSQRSKNIPGLATSFTLRVQAAEVYRVLENPHPLAVIGMMRNCETLSNCSFNACKRCWRFGLKHLTCNIQQVTHISDQWSMGSCWHCTRNLASCPRRTEKLGEEWFWWDSVDGQNSLIVTNHGKKSRAEWKGSSSRPNFLESLVDPKFLLLSLLDCLGKMKPTANSWQWLT